jgi:hypothetical protein
MAIFLVLVRAALSVLCMFVSVNSEILIVASIWGFSSGIWFCLALKALFEEVIYGNR